MHPSMAPETWAWVCLFFTCHKGLRESTILKLWVFHMKFWISSFTRKSEALKTEPVFSFGCRLWELQSATSLGLSQPPDLLIHSYAQPASLMSVLHLLLSLRPLCLSRSLELATEENEVHDGTHACSASGRGCAMGTLSNVDLPGRCSVLANLEADLPSPHQ